MSTGRSLSVVRLYLLANMFVLTRKSKKARKEAKAFLKEFIAFVQIHKYDDLPVFDDLNIRWQRMIKTVEHK